MFTKRLSQDWTAQSPWDEHHPVLELMRTRRAEASVPGRRSDSARLGLAVEGGGLRGVVSAAMLAELENLGLQSVFDEVYGCSSGAINAAYFLAGETWYPLSIYFHDLISPLFLDFRRALRGKDVLNLPYAFEVLETGKPLDYEKVIASPVPLQVMVTDVDAIRTVSVGEFTGRADLRAALQASCWLPLAVSGTYAYRGMRTVDGGVLTAHPFMIALQECTHVLSLSTRPMKPPHTRMSLLNRVVSNRLEKLRPGLGIGYLSAVAHYRSERVRLSECRTSPGEPPYVLDLAPVLGAPEVKRHEVNPARLLLDGAVVGHEIVHWAVQGEYARAIPRMTFAVSADAPPKDAATPAPALRSIGQDEPRAGLTDARCRER
jgi:predicted patatin/cPLA2 family phospholipase